MKLLICIQINASPISLEIIWNYSARQADCVLMALLHDIIE